AARVASSRLRGSLASASRSCLSSRENGSAEATGSVSRTSFGSAGTNGAATQVPAASKTTLRILMPAVASVLRRGEERKPVRQRAEVAIHAVAGAGRDEVRATHHAHGDVGHVVLRAAAVGPARR